MSLDLSEVRFDAYRASGAGGQHRNKRDTAIRLTHLPTGIVVTASEERSQYQNKQVAIQRLKDTLQERSEVSQHEQRNSERLDQLSQERVFTWTEWRNEVKSSDGAKAQYQRALKGKLEKLVR